MRDWKSIARESGPRTDIGYQLASEFFGFTLVAMNASDSPIATTSRGPPRTRPRSSSRLRGDLTGVGVGVLLGFAALILGPKELTEWSYDLLFVAHREAVPSEVLVVYMDDESHRTLNQPWFQSWDRSLHARLLQKLKAMGALAVVFDILFDLPDPEDPTGDLRFIEAIRGYGKVILAGVIEPILLNGEIVGHKPVPPFEEFRSVASWGLAEAGGEDRHARLHSRSDPRIPTLAWKAAALTGHVPEEDRLGERWLRFYGPPGALPSVSYAQMFQDDAVPAALVSNKVVFVGAMRGVGFTGGIGTDDFRTPYSRWTERRAPGVEINATVFLNLIRGDWLRRPSPWLELLLVAALGLVLGLILPRLKPLAATVAGVGLSLLLFLGVDALAWKSGVWFPWMVTAAVQVPWAVLWSWRAAFRQGKATVREAPQFTVTSVAGQAGSSLAVSLWIHTENQRADILRLAQESSFDSTIFTPSDPAAGRPPALRFAARMTLPGLRILEEEQTLEWDGSITKALFLVLTPNDIPEGTRDGVITVYASGLRVTALRFAVSIGPALSIPERLSTVEARPQRAFACYASRDRADVLARVQGMQTAVPNLEVFLDVHRLRSGQDWETALRKAILDSDIFYLFWSRNARASIEVEKEWRLALEQRGLDFISPVPLEPPDAAPPPPELATKHFNDWSLAYLQGRRKTEPVADSNAHG